ncbi:MAG TPA: hypothetical protein VIA18_06755, partial [Polyangia bacterium]|nr:hypothetical protein [Polyangia bacterium]
ITTALTEVTHHALSSVERVLVVLLALVLSLPLGVWEARRLVRGAWRNTATMVDRAVILGRTLAMSLGSYALIAAPGRFWALLRHTNAPPETELGAIVVAIFVAAAVLWRGRQSDPR